MLNVDLNIYGAFGCGNFFNFPRKFSKENENLENVFGSFSFQNSKKTKIFCFLTSMIIRKLILVVFQNILNVFSNFLRWKMKIPPFQPNAFSKIFIEN